MPENDDGNIYKENNIKVLICVPRTEDGGGANYFKSLDGLFTVEAKYFYRGNPNWPKNDDLFSNWLRLIRDYYRFIKVIRNKDFDIIHINTRFGGKGLYRDLLLLYLSKLLTKKVVCFFRGWAPEYLSENKKRLFYPLKKILFMADALITLSREEKQKLLEWGYSKPIFLESTTVDEKLIKHITRRKIKEKYSDIKNLNFLFLSRLEKEKGIYETIYAFHKLHKVNDNIRLTIAGKGKELNNLRETILEHDFKNISLEGFVKGERKKNTFSNAHLFILPTYNEGMPNVVLEAFGFGLPVVTTMVGGLKDIFTNEINGLVVEPKDPDDLANKIQRLLNDNELMSTMALTNYTYAREKFISTEVVKRLENIYHEVGKISN